MAHVIDVFGKDVEIPEGVLFDRDFSTQFPLQTYETMWRKLIRPGDKVFDIGAYVGLISIHFAELGAEVHAFEGSERNISRLEKLVRPFPNIKIHGVALSDESTERVARFNDCVDREHPPQRVRFVRYDDYAAEAELPNPNFVKMDIEGMETVALKCMSELIWEIRPRWQIEFHGGISFKYEGYPGYIPPEKGGFDFSDFERAGYRMLNSSGKRIKLREMECFENYFFVPGRMM